MIIKNLEKGTIMDKFNSLKCLAVISLRLWRELFQEPM